MSDNQIKKTKVNNIYTFLDELTSPSYLNLCVRTWFVNKPCGYEITVLNKDNLHKYIPEKFSEKFRKQTGQCSFPFFIDYLAAVVLYFNGGIFLDADTLFTKKIDTQEILLQNSDVVVYSKNKQQICSGYMMAKKGAFFLEELIRRYGFASYLPANPSSKRNFIISDSAKDFSSRDVLLLDCEDSGYLMEKKLYGVCGDYIYKKYYFSNICSVNEFFENSKGITALQNSYTPKLYKEMSEQRFLEQDILLAKILQKIITVQPV